MMMKNILMSVAITVMCCSAQAQVPQISPSVENTTFVVNNTGFKSTSIRTVAVTRPTPMHLTSGSVNLTFPSRFVVAKTDVPGGTTTWAGACGWTTPSNSASSGGVVALVPTGCNAYFEPGAQVGQWRLPTQRELLLIALVKLDLLNQGQVFSALTGTYWSSTQNGATTGWAHTFSLSVMYPRLKTDLYQVRCVRDL